jgi:phosphopantothenoylcysteine decarboxylase/phosphopantothenate--cysteine ligase
MSLIVLGVTGSIGAYKSVEVVRELQRHGHDVTAVMTESATRFVGPLTFEAITGREVVTGQYTAGANADIEHIALASKMDLLLVAPATANIVGKFANGIADDFLSALYLASTAPVLVAPAMNINMLAHAAVQANLETLSARGVQFVAPGEGYLACGWVGKGRLAEPNEIVVAAQHLLRPVGNLVGRCVLVTAGPTYEDLDPVRYLGNRSSGRMGFAVAAEAMDSGARVVLIAGPTALEPPVGAEVVHVRTAEEMFAAVMAKIDEADAVVMASAVSDYTPRAGRSDQKILKGDGDLALTLRRTPDILAELGRRRDSQARPLLVGFAAETNDMLARARAKLTAKRLDLIVANDVSRGDRGFGTETNAATIVSRDPAQADQVVPLGTKQALARVIVSRVEGLLSTSVDTPTSERVETG